MTDPRHASAIAQVLNDIAATVTAMEDLAERTLLGTDYAVGVAVSVRADLQKLRALLAAPESGQPADMSTEQVQLLAWATTNCHTLARRALARSTSVYDREKWEHILRICEKAGARSQGVLRASLPTELTEGATASRPEPRPITVRYGDLTAREHAILEAHRWQVRHTAENSPSPTNDAWTVIVGLLQLLPYAEVSAAIQKETK